MLCVAMIAYPHTSSDIHHHGEESKSPLQRAPLSTTPDIVDTIIYAARGHGSVISEGGRTKQDLAPGDFAFIPAFTEHKEVNDGDEECFFVIVRSGRSPITENLSGWSK